MTLLSRIPYTTYRESYVKSCASPIRPNQTKLLSPRLPIAASPYPTVRIPSFKGVKGRRCIAKAEAVQEKYDVYVNEQTPLQEGETKHTISVFVGDEAGLINRVAGVFGRRGSNIESLAVGLNGDQALFTIVANGTDSTINNLVKQLSKLVKVKYVEDISDAKRVDRELVMFKVNAAPGDQRTEVMQICEIFRTKIVDLSDSKLTAEVIGDQGKIAAFEDSMRKFGIIEVVRTGVISLKRGEELLEKAEKQKPSKEKKKAAKQSKKQSLKATEGADVYVVEDDVDGPWEVDNILGASQEDTDSPFKPYTLQIEVDNNPGVLNQVTGVISRRGYNVQSLAVGHSEKEGRSRICLVIPGDEESISKLLNQLHKLVNVQEVTDMTKIPFVNRELMLIKVRCVPEKRMELETLSQIFRGHLCDVSLNTVTIELAGKPRKLRAFLEIVEPYKILEIARTGCIALSRESKVSSDYLQNIQRSKIY